MEDPVAEIPQIIHTLTQAPPSVQQATLERYFAPNASFTHPFCRTGSFDFTQSSFPWLSSSRSLIVAVYRWYKILSPVILLDVESVAFDEKNLILYVTCHQLFRIWVLPFHRSPVTLTTVLRLQQEPILLADGSYQDRYRVRSQNDLYQVDQFTKFFSVLRLTWLLVMVWHFTATALCVLGELVLRPVLWAEESPTGRKWLQARQAHEERVWIEEEKKSGLEDEVLQ